MHAIIRSREFYGFESDLRSVPVVCPDLPTSTNSPEDRHAAAKYEMHPTLRAGSVKFLAVWISCNHGTQFQVRDNEFEH